MRKYAFGRAGDNVTELSDVHEEGGKSQGRGVTINWLAQVNTASFDREKGKVSREELRPREELKLQGSKMQNPGARVDCNLTR